MNEGHRCHQSPFILGSSRAALAGRKRLAPVVNLGSERRPEDRVVTMKIFPID